MRSSHTTTTPSDDSTDGIALEYVDPHPKINSWDREKLFNNFSPAVKQAFLEKDVPVEALISYLLYIASSKGDNLVLGYVVEKLKARPKKGQRGVYLRIAGDPLQEIVNRLISYLEYLGFRNRDWRLAMGTPSTDKILELLDHLGLDASEFSDRWEDGW